MFFQKQQLTKGNNFTILRIYLSMSVVFFHCSELSGLPALDFLNSYFNGERAVQAFFIISGYLIMKSYYRSTSLKDFFLKRIRRIYPAYVTVVLACGILGVLITSETVTAYFTSPVFYKYIISNLFFLNFLQPSLPGVFTHNNFSTVNGSLWTLKVEVGYYLLVPFIALVSRKINTHMWYALLFILSACYYYGFKTLAEINHNDTFLFLSRQIPGQLFYFIAGAWITELEKSKVFFKLIKWLGIPALFFLFIPLPFPLYCVSLAAAVFFLANAVPEIKLPFLNEDISYGLYIYHFPVIQVLIVNGVYTKGAVPGFLWSVLITVTLAVLSWIFIEKPFIIKNKKARYFKKEPLHIPENVSLHL